MGVAYYLLFDDGTATDGGKAIARLAGRLDRACRALGLPELEDDAFVDPEDLDLPGDDPNDLSPRDGPRAEEPWFDPAEGRDYFRALLDHVLAHPDSYQDPHHGPHLAADLEECVRALDRARSAGRRWYLAIDL